LERGKMRGANRRDNSGLEEEEAAIGHGKILARACMYAYKQKSPVSGLFCKRLVRAWA
jgi:hypothetical protein